jgi:hydrogenase maturation protein HypF
MDRFKSDRKMHDRGDRNFPLSRRSMIVRGIVQGVGFRPFVHRLATGLALGGFIRNRAGIVQIEVEGPCSVLDEFASKLVAQAPTHASIQDIESVDGPPLGGQGFRIETSVDPSATEAVQVSPDLATCDDCLAELFDPADRRHGYPFISCTQCGPRLTVIKAAPYDRERTAWAAFPMCARCRADYDDAGGRRHQAQGNACAACGPRVCLRGVACEDPILQAAVALREGRIVAIKGLGGYHLAVDASNDKAVGELRRRKCRDEKPFAILASAGRVATLCHLSPPERDLLQGPQHPIVLLRRRPDAGVAESVAPGNPRLGVMLPYTPLHHLLLRAAGDTPLVMTSGNRSDEPIAFEDTDAFDRLSGIADLFLVHDRPILLRCDDSIAQVTENGVQVIRRSRGYAPGTLPLPMSCRRPVLALGGQLKSTVAFGWGRRALVSHHLGDLDDHRAYCAFADAIRHCESLFASVPAVLCHDLHPDYASTVYARERSLRDGLPCIGVQHHHAHMASCMAENGVNAPVIGVTFDGSGYGTDGAIWGGEFLVGDFRAFRRAAHLRTVPLPGGDRAIREPWRMALSHLLDAGESTSLMERRRPAADVRIVRSLIEKRLFAPPTSSMGRLFDAVASLAGLRDEAAFEGQAAMELQWAAERAESDGAYPFELSDGVIDTRPLIGAVGADIRRGASIPAIARRFHSALVNIIETVCGRLRETTGLRRVVLSGGVFQNGLLSAEAARRLSAHGFEVYTHRLLPPNDGGLALGQLAIAAALDGDES